ncbi:MAG: S-layer homology domain-containing protein [bacterium]
MPTIQQANIEGKLLRSHLAKMLSVYATTVLEDTPDTTTNCSFTDMKNQSKEMQYYAVVACQLGLMGLNADGTPATKFDPNEEVTRAQFGTTLSRLLYEGENNTSDGTKRYTKHLEALKNAGIMKNISTPTMDELRGNVFIMLMRASK